MDERIRGYVAVNMATAERARALPVGALSTRLGDPFCSLRWAH